VTRTAVQPSRIWLRVRALSVQFGVLHIFAAAIVSVVLWLNVLFWPVSHLGFDADPLTGRIHGVTPGSAADRAGLRVDDRVLSLYNYPWHTLLVIPNTLPLIRAPDSEVPITFERRTQGRAVIRAGVLIKQSPSLATQTTKGAMLLLSFLCWITGYLLGVVRRQDATSSALVAFFWLALAGTLGLYYVALNISLPLCLFIQWCILAVLAPLAVYIHCWFPRRTLTARSLAIIRAILWTLCSIITLCIVLIVCFWPFVLLQLSLVLSAYVIPVVILIACLISAILLRHTYHRHPSAHVRRQVRLIAFACMLSATGWLFTVLLPIWLALPALVADQRTNLVLVCIPLAYLVGGITPDLYRVDRVVARLALHVTVLTVLTALFAAVNRQFNFSSPAAVFWSVIGFVACYRPVQRIIRRLPPFQQQSSQYDGLHQAATNLTTTLDQALLVDFLLAGVRETFEEPALAFYSGANDVPNVLTLVMHDRFSELPEVVRPGMLTDCLCRLNCVMLSQQLAQNLSNQPLHPVEAQIIQHHGIVVWGSIRHANGSLLGILLLGLRGDLDPYRREDLHELQRLLDAAALAFANSVAYSAQREAEGTIRALYQQLAEAQQETAAAIARELHDEIINLSVRLNIEALQKIIARTNESTMRSELELVLETEQGLVQALRMVCERLHPVGIDDPFALSAVLRMQVEHIRAIWDGQCRLDVRNTPLPVAPQVQYEAMQIVHEALINAVKHAQAVTEIVVDLQYPATADGMIRITIRDNGQNFPPISIKPGHLGIRGMLERARLVGGQLAIELNEGGGTKVIFTFAPTTTI
jgi:signal transduction histidine kinase